MAGLTAVKGRKAGLYILMWKDFQDLLREKSKVQKCVYTCDFLDEYV